MTLALILGCWLAVLLVLLVAHHRFRRAVARKELLARVVAALEWQQRQHAAERRIRLTVAVAQRTGRLVVCTPPETWLPEGEWTC